MPPAPPEETLRATLDALGVLRNRAATLASEILGTLPLAGDERLQSALDSWTDEVAALARALVQAVGAEETRIEAATGRTRAPVDPATDVLPLRRPWSPPLPRAPR